MLLLSLTIVLIRLVSFQNHWSMYNIHLAQDGSDLIFKDSTNFLRLKNLMFRNNKVPRPLKFVANSFASTTEPTADCKCNAVVWLPGCKGRVLTTADLTISNFNARSNHY